VTVLMLLALSPCPSVPSFHSHLPASPCLHSCPFHLHSFPCCPAERIGRRTCSPATPSLFCRFRLCEEDGCSKLSEMREETRGREEGRAVGAVEGQRREERWLLLGRWWSGLTRQAGRRGEERKSEGAKGNGNCTLLLLLLADYQSALTTLSIQPELSPSSQRSSSSRSPRRDFLALFPLALNPAGSIAASKTGEEDVGDG
jgi:hypothetical protein